MFKSQSGPEEFFNKVYGCLAGVAVGDAMGMPGSGYLPHEIKETFGYIDRLFDAPLGHPHHDGLRKGHITDDTELTMLVIEMILEDGVVTPNGMAKRILEWATKKRLLDSGLLGPSTTRAIIGLKEGKDPSETGWKGTTNGAAMKIAPIGIINFCKRKKLIEDVEKVCIPSHNTSVAISAASAIAGAISEALCSSSTVDSIIEAAKEYSLLGEKKGRPVAFPSIDKRIELAIRLIKEKPSIEAANILYSYIGADVSCVNSIPTVFGLLKAAKGDPMKAIMAASNMGGDTDTIASMVGGVSGALNGITAFPSDIVRQVEKESNLDLKNITKSLLDYSRR